MKRGSQGVVVPGPRAKRRRVTVQRAPPTRSRVCARVAKRAPVCHHYARRPYKSRPTYRGRLRRRLELTRQSFELTPGTTPPIVEALPTANLSVFQVLPRNIRFEEAIGVVTMRPDRFNPSRTGFVRQRKTFNILNIIFNKKYFN